MTTTGMHAIDTSVNKTNQWLSQLSEKLHVESRDSTLSCLRAVLHALRDRLTVEECAHLSAQLPVIVRGVYFEGWQPARVPDKSELKTKDDFILRVGDELPLAFKARAAEVVVAVFHVLAQNVSPGEANKVATLLPKGIRDLWPVTLH
jgi:uncharacterized protein (DUF2267 family)